MKEKEEKDLENEVGEEGDGEHEELDDEEGEGQQGPEEDQQMTAQGAQGPNASMNVPESFSFAKFAKRRDNN